MVTLVKICREDEVPEGEMKGFDVGGKPVAVARVGGEFFAFSNVCTHAECDLAGGMLEGQVVTCWCHGSEFDIKTGEVKSPPAEKPLPVYKIKVKNGEVWGEV